MIGSGYSWESINHFSGMPTRRLFDRFNGDQVLFIINSYGSGITGFSIEDARLVEQKIREQLPMESKSEISVLNWIISEMQMDTKNSKNHNYDV